MARGTEAAENPAARKTWPRRLMALAIGVGVAAGVIEITLRSLGLAMGVRVHHNPTPRGGPPDFILCCIGDSHTAGVGAPAGFSYPDQLKVLLDRLDPDRVYDVRNEGLPGRNTSELVTRMDVLIRDSGRAPDLTIFQAGKNNQQNLHDASIIDDPAVQHDDFRFHARYLLAKSRAYRLSQITVARLKQIALRARDQDPGYGEMFNLESPEERALLTDWIVADLTRLRDELTQRGGKLALLNYWDTTPWVEDAYARLAATGTPRIDIHHFGLGFSEGVIADSDLVVRNDFHPTARGYALVAEIVLSALRKDQLIPEPNEPESQNLE